MATEEKNISTERWERLKAMRDRRDGVETPAPVKLDDPSRVTQARDDDGKFAKPAEASEPAERSTEPAVPPPAEQVEQPKPPPVQTSTEPTAEEIEVEIEGVKQKIAVDPSLAEAFKKAEKVRVEAEAAEAEAKKTIDKEALKAELRDELKRELAAQKTAADIAAEEALAAAEAEKNRPKKPASDLLISNPDQWQKEQEAYEEYRVSEATDKVRRETMAEVQKQQQKATVDAEKQGRLVLREQFYSNYPALKSSSDLVDVMLEKQIDAVLASGKLAKPLQPKEAEALKAQTFATVATEATKRLAKLMGAARTVVVPPPPTLVSSAPERKPVPKTEAPKAERERYPKGSVSAMLAAHKQSKAKPAA